ncbi:MAG: hypothetical protein ABI353_02065, partial [Isosphaeraceae bacterium]
RAFAARLLADAANDDARINLAYRLAYARSPTANEQAEAIAFLHDQGKRVDGKAQSADPQAVQSPNPDAHSAALVDFCHAIFNTSEFLYID